ncbi:hypothetical protein JW948_00440 [bacterium]|nr:hypothetical protein [bacterium]
MDNQNRPNNKFTGKRHLRGEVLLSLIIFAAIVYLAWWFGWETADLAWGLWISSLTVGYSLILASIFGQSVQKNRPDLEHRFSKTHLHKMPRSLDQAFMGVLVVLLVLFMIGINRFTIPFLWLTAACSAVSTIPYLFYRAGRPFQSAFLLGIFGFIGGFPFMIFMLAIFSVHFLGFHFVHSLFLNAFFPRVNPNALFNTMEEGFHLYRTLLAGLIRQFWPFILASMISRLPEYKKAFNLSTRSMMTAPYGNVARMHVMIILFGFFHVLQCEGGMLYLLLVLYFFPVGKVLQKSDLRRKRS